MSPSIQINRILYVSVFVLFVGHSTIANAQSKKSIDEAIQWLEKKKASDPASTEIAMQTCKHQLPAHGDIGDLINCMYGILGD